MEDRHSRSLWQWLLSLKQKRFYGNLQIKFHLTDSGGRGLVGQIITGPFQTGEAYPRKRPVRSHPYVLI